MKYYIISGEASGDLHGSNLIKELKILSSSSIFRAWGGDKMQNAGATIVKHYKEQNFMGFVEVVLNLKKILKNISFCKKDILSFQPDVIILVDYPGFNLRIAEWAKKNGFKVVYYISPQIWAWKASRVKIIKKSVDLMLTILPFEKEFYKKYNYDVEYVGHPLLDCINPINQTSANQNQKNILLLPGSRTQEIKRMLPIMCETAKQNQNFDFYIAALSNFKKEFYQKHIKSSNVKIEFDNLPNLFKKAHAAIVTSGTATLETALHNIPMIVCYKSNAISFLIARLLIKVKYISIVNLLLNKRTVYELIQNDLNIDNLNQELFQITNNTETRNKMLEDYKELNNILCKKNASKNAANLIFNKFFLKQ